MEITKKTKTYRGKELEELKEMDIREFAKFTKARTRRTLLRNYDIIQKFLKNCEKKEAKNKPIKTHLRDIVIVPQMVGKTLYVHNGKEFVKVQISFEMLGHRLGEFAPTRKVVKHGNAGVGATKSSASRSVK